MTRVVSYTEGTREGKRIRSVIWGSILLLVVVGGVWRSQAVAADAVTDANVAAAIAAAKTSQDYEALAAYFRAQATAAGEEVQLHQAMLQSWEKAVSIKGREHMLTHCRNLIDSYRKQQKESESLARQYDSMAKAAGGK